MANVARGREPEGSCQALLARRAVLTAAMDTAALAAAIGGLGAAARAFRQHF